MKGVKAAGLDSITAKHLPNSHPIQPGILAKLFNLCYGLVTCPVISVRAILYLYWKQIAVLRIFQLMTFMVSRSAIFYRKYLKIAFYVASIIFSYRQTTNLDSRSRLGVLMLFIPWCLLLITTFQTWKRLSTIRSICCEVGVSSEQVRETSSSMSSCPNLSRMPHGSFNFIVTYVMNTTIYPITFLTCFKFGTTFSKSFSVIFLYLRVMQFYSIALLANGNV
jgi:hypothetical protein